MDGRDHFTSNNATSTCEVLDAAPSHAKLRWRKSTSDAGLPIIKLPDNPTLTSGCRESEATGRVATWKWARVDEACESECKDCDDLHLERR